MNARIEKLKAPGNWQARLNANPPLTALLAVTLLPLLFGLITGRMGLSHWITFTVAGTAMGMMLFLMAAGMTLVFGLMNVMNLAHGAFISIGAMIAFGVLSKLAPADYLQGSFIETLGWIGLAVLIAAVVGAVLGYVFERLVVKPVYGNAMKEILITLGAGLILIEILNAINNDTNAGAAAVIRKADAVAGSFIYGDVVVQKYRLLVAAVGLAVFIGADQLLRRTRLGLLIRAGVESREMVEVMGYRIKQLFVGVFMAATAIAAVGGVLWGVYEESFDTAVGNTLLISVIVVIIIGGMGSIAGCFVGALLVGLVTNYVGYLAPGLTNISTVLLLVAILMWRPQGLIPVFRS